MSDETERRGYLYRHIRKDKDEVFYIGIGFEKNHARAYSHHSRNRYWKNIVALTDFDVEILFDDLPEKQLVEKEKEFIALYGRKDLKEGVLVNMTDGGDGAVRCRFKNPVTWAKIKSNPEKYRIICENKRQPFNIIVKEPNREEYVIKCGGNIEFPVKTGLGVTYLHFLKSVDHKVITKINASHKHKFPLGTMLKYEKLEKKKLIYPKKKKLKYVKPFNVLVYDVNGNLIDEIFCGKTEDFTKNTKLNCKVLKSIRKYESCEIKMRFQHTKHPYPVGTIVKTKFLKKCDK